MSNPKEQFEYDPEVFTRKFEAAFKQIIDSASTPYTPGDLSRAYNKAPKHRQVMINQETDRIFKEYSGVARKLDQSKKDLKFRRQWLRIRDLVIVRILHLEDKQTDLPYRWAIYQVNLGKRMLEIDIEDRSDKAPITQPLVNSLVFRQGKGSYIAPAGFTLIRKRPGSFDRWTVTWDSKVNLARKLTWPFVNAIAFPGSFGARWRAKSQRARVAQQKEVNRQMRILRTPLKEFGGRTPLEVMKLPPGNYEVKGQGFITVSKNMVCFQEFFSSAEINEAVRWFLRRHISILMAPGLNAHHQSGLLKQALVGTVLTMNGGAKLREFGGSNSAGNLLMELGKQNLKDLADVERKAKTGKADVDLISIVSEAAKTFREKDAQATVDRLTQQSTRTDGLKLLRPIR